MANGIFLSQAKYVTYLLAHFHMSDFKRDPMPFQSDVRFTIECATPLVDATLYLKLIGSLIFLTHSKPDLCFAVSMVSRFMKKPREIYWQAAKRMM